MATGAWAYIAVPGERLTLPEIMLEFPTIVELTLEKSDASKGAFLFQVRTPLQGAAPMGRVRAALLHEQKLPPAFAALQDGQSAVVFLGSPDNRSLWLTSAGWFLTKPGDGWERFAEFRADMNAVCSGSPTELAQVVRALGAGDTATLPIRRGQATAWVRYDAQFPHRRWLALAPQQPALSATAAVQQLAQPDPLTALVGLAHQPQLPAAAVPPVLKLLAAGPVDVRQAALEVLAAHRPVPDQAVPALAKVLHEEDRFLCVAAAWALLAYGPAAQPAVPDLVKCLAERNFDHDYRPHRAAAAAEALLRIAPGTPAAEAGLRLLLSDKMLNDQRSDSEGTRAAAARSLGRCGPAAKGAIGALRQRLTDPLVTVRISAAEALLLIGAPAEVTDAAAQVLVRYLVQGTAGEQQQVRRALPGTRTVMEPRLRAASQMGDAATQARIRAVLADLK
jgi:hypothetical protein